jgi:hypothetical protein
MVLRQKDEETMTNDTGPIRRWPLRTMQGTESNRSETIPVEQIVDETQRPINDDKVVKFMGSIQSVGLLSPPVVAPRQEQDGKGKYQLVAGRIRFEAIKRLGITEIRCTVLGRSDALRVELAEIDKNLIRNDLTPAQHAILTGHRAEVLRELAERDGTVSQDETASRQARRRAGERTGPEPASLRDQANKTCETKDSIYRSKKRFENIGGDILKRISGTCLDKGVQLDALTKLSKEERHDLADRAATGEKVSATTLLRKTKPVPLHRQSHGPEERRRTINVGNAFAAFRHWQIEFSSLEVIKSLKHQILELDHPLWLASCEENGTDPEDYFTIDVLDSEEGEARPKKRDLIDRLMGRKGD